MDTSPFLATEYFLPKEGNFEEVLEMLNDSSEMIKDCDGLMMHMVFKPKQKNKAIKVIGLWESEVKFKNFAKGEHAQKIMNTGLGEKMKNLTDNIDASFYTMEHGWHAENHN